MGKRIILSENEKNNIKSLYEDIEGVENGNIKYKNKEGEDFTFSVNHPIIGKLPVLKFDTNTWDYIFEPSWSQRAAIKASGSGSSLNNNGQIVGSVEQSKRGDILNNMELGKSFVMKTNQGTLTFEQV